MESIIEAWQSSHNHKIALSKTQQSSVLQTISYIVTVTKRTEQAKREGWLNAHKRAHTGSIALSAHSIILCLSPSSRAVKWDRRVRIAIGNGWTTLFHFSTSSPSSLSLASIRTIIISARAVLRSTRISLSLALAQNFLLPSCSALWWRTRDFLYFSSFLVRHSLLWCACTLNGLGWWRAKGRGYEGSFSWVQVGERSRSWSVEKGFLLLAGSSYRFSSSFALSPFHFISGDGKLDHCVVRIEERHKACKQVRP